jgi:hypothetical protein
LEAVDFESKRSGLALLQLPEIVKEDVGSLQKGSVIPWVGRESIGELDEATRAS